VTACVLGAKVLMAQNVRFYITVIAWMGTGRPRQLSGVTVSQWQFTTCGILPSNTRPKLRDKF